MALTLIRKGVQTTSITLSGTLKTDKSIEANNFFLNFAEYHAFKY